MRPVDWAKFDGLFGRLSVAEIARMAGVSRAAAYKRQKKLEAAREALKAGPVSEAALRLVRGRTFSVKIFAQGGLTLVGYEPHATEGYVSQQLRRFDNEKELPPLIDLTRDGRAMDYWRDLVLTVEVEAEDFFRTLRPL